MLKSGVERIFGVIGNGNEGLISTYADALPGGYVPVTHESAAVSMADGYSRRSGRVGVATTTHGPGVTNALTSLTEASRARSAVLLLTSETAPQREHRQWLDLRAAAGLAGAAYRKVHSAETAIDDICDAMRLAHIAQKPVLLNVPKALLETDVASVDTAFGFDLGQAQRITPDEDRLDAALGIIAAANRPVVLAGRGAVLSHARDALIDLARTLQAPAATTVVALDYLAGYELNLGIFGNESHSLAIEYLSQADCVIAIGAGLNEHTTGNGDLLRGKALVHCDSNLGQLNARVPTAAAVWGDARVFAERVTRELKNAGERPPSQWAETLRGRLKSFDEASDYIDGSGPDTIDMRTAMMTLNRVLPENRVLITDNGRFKTAPWRHLRCSPGEFAHTGAFGSIGLGLPHAIGASFARPKDIVVAVTGDGGLMQCFLELTTAVRYRQRLVLAVLNDGSYGSEYKALRLHGHDPAHSLMQWPSFASVAESLGARGVVIRTSGDIEALTQDFQNLAEPIVLDIRADPAVDCRKYK